MSFPEFQARGWDPRDGRMFKVISEASHVGDTVLVRWYPKLDNGDLTTEEMPYSFDFDTKEQWLIYKGS